jgi:hypothetical protein
MTLANPHACAGELGGSLCAAVRALGAHAAAHPVAPCVFFQDDIDWRWIDWATIAARVAAAARRLGSPQDLADRVVAYRSEPTVDALVLDLALQHAGAVPRPSASPHDEHPGPALRAWIATPAEPVVEGDAGECVAGSAARWRRENACGVAGIGAGCSAPLPALSRSGWLRRFSAWLGRPPLREIVVDVLELERPLCRAGVSWTLEQGGALVLAHERESLTATARWARPTRLWAESERGRFERLVDATLGRRQRRPERRRERLMSAVWCGPQKPSAATLEALERSAVAVSEWRPLPAAPEPPSESR